MGEVELDRPTTTRLQVAAPGRGGTESFQACPGGLGQGHKVAVVHDDEIGERLPLALADLRLHAGPCVVLGQPTVDEPVEPQGLRTAADLLHRLRVTTLSPKL